MDLHLATAIAITLTSPTHSKTQHQLSPGTHVVVLVFMGLERPPTACGVPLSALTKSTLCPCEIAEKPPQRQLYSCVVLFSTRKSAQRCQVHPFQEGIFAAFTAHPHGHTFLNLRAQPLQDTVPNLHHRTQPASISFGRHSHQSTH